jgi:peptidoglycan/LPS O-acetylase OafA/YrhL
MRSSLWWHAVQISNVYFWQHYTWKYAWPASHLWTLSVEEQFYLVWPFLIWFTPRRWLPASLIAIWAIGPVYRWLTGFDDFMCLLPPASFDALAAGALTAIAPSLLIYGLAIPAAPLALAAYISGADQTSETLSVLWLGPIGLTQSGTFARMAPAG